jgi:hypothetical protein
MYKEEASALTLFLYIYVFCLLMSHYRNENRRNRYFVVFVFKIGNSTYRYPFV